MSARDSQLDSREGQAKLAEGPVVVIKAGNSGGAKGPSFKVNVQSGDSQENDVSLLPPETAGELQQALPAKAKESHDYRFYTLNDKVYRIDVLWHAYRICRRNDGAPGVAGRRSMTASRRDR